MNPLYISIIIFAVLLLKPLAWAGMLLSVRFLVSRQIAYEKHRVVVEEKPSSERSTKQATKTKQSITKQSIKQKINKNRYYFIEGLKRYASVKTGWLPSQSLRKWIYRHVFLMNMGEDVVIYGRTEIWEPHKVTMGKGSIVSDKTFLDGRFGIEIGENVNMGIDVKIFTNQHDVNSPSFSTEGKYGKVVIGNRVWLSAGSIILPRVTIGEGAVVAAGSVVTKDLEPFGIYAGIPARKIGERNKNLTYNLEGNHLWFM